MIWVKIFFIAFAIAAVSPVVYFLIWQHNDDVDNFNSHLYIGDTVVFRRNCDIFIGVICKTYREDITVKVKGDYFTISSSQVLEKLNRKKRFFR